jgi:PadR family transcriptional regulator PadR
MKRKKHLGELEQMVLMAVLQLKQDAYGTSVLNELRDRAGRRISPGALFGTMDRLEAKGFVTSRVGDPTPGRGGKRKRYLTVTRQGVTALREARTAWARMSEGLEQVLRP